MKTFHLNSTCNYVNVRTVVSFPLTFSSNFLSFDSFPFIFCVFMSYKLKNVFFLDWLVYSEAGIESCSVKQLFGKMDPKLLFFYKTAVSFQYCLLNKKVHKYIKSEILSSYCSRVMVIKSLYSVTELLFFHSCEWLPLVIYLINYKCNQKIRHIIRNNQIITHHIISRRKT